MENEGWQVARALADKGVAAFVLKYRLNQTPEDLETFAHMPGPAPPPRTAAVAPADTPTGTPPLTRPAPTDMATRLSPKSPTPRQLSLSSVPTPRSGTSIPTALG